MIRYFSKGLRSSIWVQLDGQNRELDSGEKAVEKFANVELKPLLQSVLNIRELDSRCLQGNKLAKKEGERFRIE